ncbi:MAG: hypothetical protein JW955_09750 [Sedimentisphaerales bacterium]|nr:hypothetical protein [Sedimentisphaerales bacterium]
MITRACSALGVVLTLVACGVCLAEGSDKLAIDGQVVDYLARPVAGAEVAVYEWHGIGGSDRGGKLVAPIVKTDSSGRFQCQASVSDQYGTFIVARKKGLALAWDGLNYSRYTKGKGHFLLVLEPPCVLTGQVVDSEGSPVADAQVQALPVTSYLYRLRQRPILAPEEWFTTTTDSQGKLRFTEFAADVAASFRVKAPSRGSVHVVRMDRPASCGFEVWRSDIRLQLADEGSIKGRVVDDRGQPVSGVGLMISPNSSATEVTKSYLARKIASDQNGVFTFDGIPEGLSQIRVLVPEEGPDLWCGKGTDVLVKAGQTAPEATIRVTKGGTLEVTALSAWTKRPVPGAKVGINGRDWRRDKPALTDAKGFARVRAPAGEYSVYVAADEFSTYQSKEQVAAGQTLRYEAALSLAPRVYGSVLDADGEPVNDAAVSIHPFGDHAYTDGNGRFDAAYDTRYGAQGGLVMARAVNTNRACAVDVEDWSRPMRLKLSPAWTLTGKIVGPDGTGIPAARVKLSMSTWRCLTEPGVEVLTDARGRFEMKAIPPVREGFTYRLSLAAAGYGLTRYLRISPNGAPGAVVDIGPTGLPLANQSISGVVVDASGRPAAYVPILVNPLPGVSQSLKTTSTNERGEFVLTRLCKGPIRLQANFGSSPGGSGNLKAEPPAKDLKIILGQDLTHEAGASLLGKRLPDLRELALSSAPIGRRAVLVCFFDFQQRPSRTCVLQLTRQAEQLEREGLVVVAVQAARADEAAFRTWATQVNISSPVGMIAAEEAKTRAAWGVRSLPWLILTDRDHIVVAEGFSIDEVNDKITK